MFRCNYRLYISLLQKLLIECFSISYAVQMKKCRAFWIELRRRRLGEARATEADLQIQKHKFYYLMQMFYEIVKKQALDFMSPFFRTSITFALRRMFENHSLYYIVISLYRYFFLYFNFVDYHDKKYKLLTSVAETAVDQKRLTSTGFATLAVSR